MVGMCACVIHVRGKMLTMLWVKRKGMGNFSVLSCNFCVSLNYITTKAYPKLGAWLGGRIPALPPRDRGQPVQAQGTAVRCAQEQAAPLEDKVKGGLGREGSKGRQGKP